MKTHALIRRITLDAVFIALLSVSAYISIPLGAVPFTLQLLVVMILSLLLSPLDAFLVILLYLILGLVGLPVFAGGTGGFVKLTSLSFGFILGWLVEAPVTSLLYRALSRKLTRKGGRVLAAGIASLIGWLICYLLGFAYIVFLMYVLQVTKTSDGVRYVWSLSKILMTCIVQFIPLDLVKIALASFVSPRLATALAQRNMKGTESSADSATSGK